MGERYNYYYGVWAKGRWPQEPALAWLVNLTFATEWASLHVYEAYEIHREWLTWTPDESRRTETRPPMLKDADFWPKRSRQR